MTPATWIDGHLDLAYVALLGRDLTVPVADPTTAAVSLPGLRDAGVEVVFGTIFTEPTETPDEPSAYLAGDADAARVAGVRQLDVYRRWADEGEITIVRTRADLDDDGPTPKVVLLMEGADPIRDADDVAWWHEAGLRLVGLTWGAGTRYAGGNARHGPLTDAGRHVVAALDDAGIVHDVSHLADAALDDLLGCATGRIVATHSNARALMPGDNQRHLRDEHIGAIADRDGIVGLNLYTAFLASGRRATIDDAVDHVAHVVSIMGHRDGVALGSDMDGGFGPEGLPEGLERPADLPRLGDALRAGGWSADDVAGFAHGNWRRLLDEIL